MEYFNLDVIPIQQRCEERGDIKHVRFPIRDFDPYDLRMKLPKAVARLAKEHDPSKGTAYVHCTAGMGRAPATAVAYMAWVRGIPVDEAYEQMTTVRRCSPKIQAIRYRPLMQKGGGHSTLKITKPAPMFSGPPPQICFWESAP